MDRDLSGKDLSGADFADADLTRANLSEVNLTEAHMIDADLTGANLTGAFLHGADLTGADLSHIIGGDLSGAILEERSSRWSVSLAPPNGMGWSRPPGSRKGHRQGDAEIVQVDGFHGAAAILRSLT